MIAIIGANGSMGKRYQAILKYLYQPFKALDRADMLSDEIIEAASECDRIIICSPTHTHIQYLNALLPTKKPILCEKPVTKDTDELEDLHAMCARHGYSYHMVYQYKELLTESRGDSRYNYFRHGQDGLLWDCIQIVGLARGRILLNDQSPIWECQVNGQSLSLADMDKAYVTMVQRWIAGSLDQSMDEILKVHKKVAELSELRAIDV